MDYKIKYRNEAIGEVNKGFLCYRSKELKLGQKFKRHFQQNPY